MTEQQVLDAFKGQAVRLEKPQPTDPRKDRTVKLTIPKYEIDGTSYDVRFGFNKDGGLNVVTLMSMVYRNQDAAVISRGEGASLLRTAAAFDALTKLLTQRYGAPTSQTGGPRKREAMWSLPSTIIELGYMYSAMVMEVVTLTYSPPSSEGNKL
jgi:hypothetical protein